MRHQKLLDGSEPTERLVPKCGVCGDDRRHDVGPSCSFCDPDFERLMVGVVTPATSSRSVTAALGGVMAMMAVVMLTGCAETLPPAPAPPITGFGWRLPPLPELPPYPGNGGNDTAGVPAPDVSPPSHAPSRARLYRPAVTPPMANDPLPVRDLPPLRPIEDDPPALRFPTPETLLTPAADATDCWGYWRICHFY